MKVITLFLTHVTVTPKRTLFCKKESQQFFENVFGNYCKSLISKLAETMSYTRHKQYSICCCLTLCIIIYNC